MSLYYKCNIITLTGEPTWQVSLHYKPNIHSKFLGYHPTNIQTLTSEPTYKVSIYYKYDIKYNLLRLSA